VNHKGTAKRRKERGLSALGKKSARRQVGGSGNCAKEGQVPFRRKESLKKKAAWAAKERGDGDYKLGVRRVTGRIRCAGTRSVLDRKGKVAAKEGGADPR